jgi:hypothetical protein
MEFLPAACGVSFSVPVPLADTSLERVQCAQVTRWNNSVQPAAGVMNRAAGTRPVGRLSTVSRAGGMTAMSAAPKAAFS